MEEAEQEASPRENEAVDEVEQSMHEESTRTTPVGTVEYVGEAEEFYELTEVQGESKTKEHALQEEHSSTFEYSSSFGEGSEMEIGSHLGEEDNIEENEAYSVHSSSVSTSQVSSTAGKRNASSERVGPPSKPCFKDKMRKWLRTTRNESENESFLGSSYSTKRRNFNHLLEPCEHIAFNSQNIMPSSALEQGEKKTMKERLCSCKIPSMGPMNVVTQRKDLRETSQQQNLTTSDNAVCCCHKVKAKDDSRNTESERSRTRLPVCDCDESKREAPSIAEKLVKELQRLQTKRQRLEKKLWTKYRDYHCKCRKSQYSKTHHKASKPCTCEKIHAKRKILRNVVTNLRFEEIDKGMVLMEMKLRGEKIDCLFNDIGPELAKEYQELSDKYERKEPQTNAFVEMVKKEFGQQLREFRVTDLKNGNVHHEYDRNDCHSLQYVELPNGSCYYGQFSPLGMEGKCLYKMAHGPIFVGTVVDGQMEGPGKLIYPNGGVLEGVWVNGTLFSPKYVFYDGLKFEPTNWKYCRIPDRRFVSEIMNGMNSPDNVQLCPNHPSRQIPKGCLDAGEGFYDPQQRVIIHPSTGKVTRIVGEQEANWIVQHCRREWFEEVPFSRYMYENWYAGTVFPPPEDEPDWFNSEFPKVVLPYTTVTDVLEARRIAMQVAAEPNTLEPGSIPS